MKRICEIWTQNTVHSCYNVYARGKNRAQYNVWTWYLIFTFHCLQFSTQVYQTYYGVIRAHKTMEPSRCELLVRFNKFFEKSTFKKVLGLGNKKHLLNDFLHALNIASAFCRYFVSLLVTRLICMIVWFGILRYTCFVILQKHLNICG